MTKKYLFSASFIFYYVKPSSQITNLILELVGLFNFVVLLKVSFIYSVLLALLFKKDKTLNIFSINRSSFTGVKKNFYHCWICLRPQPTIKFLFQIILSCQFFTISIREVFLLQPVQSLLCNNYCFELIAQCKQYNTVISEFHLYYAICGIVLFAFDAALLIIYQMILCSNLNQIV